MNEELITCDNTISSMEVAEMLERAHGHVLRSIRTYSEQFNQSKIALVDFWTETSYIDTKGERRSCYNVTKKGCEFLAHKTTGTKGTVFTARYINRFHEMEAEIKSNIPKTESIPCRNAYPLPLKSDKWHFRNLEKIKTVCDVVDAPVKEFYHHFWIYMDKQGIDVDELNTRFQEERRREAKHTGELIDHFVEVEEKANEYLFHMLQKASWWNVSDGN